MASEQHVVSAADYWNRMNLNEGHSCPNVSLFRFLGYGGIDLAGKNILEIGFGANRGRDLLECRDRGGVIYGADISRNFIEYFKERHPEIPVSEMDAGTDEVPFGIDFDLIYHRDMISYLSDEQIEFHFLQTYRNLARGGHLVFQFIENDLNIRREMRRKSYRTDFDVLKNANMDEMFRGGTNPLRSLSIDWLISTSEKAGFSLMATKTLIESYTMDESVYRINRYLMLKKAPNDGI